MAVLVLSTVAVASAHALLLDSTPKAETAVSAPPRLILRFNSRIEARLSSVVLIGGPRRTRELLVKDEATPEQPEMLIYTLPPLEPGRYRVEWKALSVDGHLTNGVLKFDVVAPASRPER
jgi:copper resistance protein C